MYVINAEPTSPPRPRYYHINTRENHINLEEIKRLTPENIVIHIFYECRYYELLDQQIHLEDIIDLAHEIGSRIVLITGSAKLDHVYQWNLNHPSHSRYKRGFDRPEKRYDIVDLQFWQTFNWVQQHFRLSEVNTLRDKLDIEVIREYNRDFYYLFLTLNNIVKNNRCMQMDTLAKYDLLDRGTYSWQSWTYSTGRDIFNSSGYNFKYWNPEIRVLDYFPKKTDPNNIYDHGAADGYIPPDELKKTFVQIITETHYTEIYFTEKTSTPIYFGKLFLVNGAKHFHRALENLGFKLYTEIFDYSFDNEDDLEKRVDQLTHNIFKLRNKTPYELRAMYNDVLPKIEYNKQHLRQLAISFHEIPPLYKQIWQENQNSAWGNFIQSIYKEKSNVGVQRG